MQKPSSDNATAVRSHRIAAALFVAGAAVCAGLFARGITRDQILSGTFTYGLICSVTAWGLWRSASWGRTIALILVVGNVGLGALQLIAVLVSGRGRVIPPLIVIGVSVALGYLLGRSSTPKLQDDPR